jgi:hypothetical protein
MDRIEREDTYADRQWDDDEEDIECVWNRERDNEINNGIRR